MQVVTHFWHNFFLLTLVCGFFHHSKNKIINNLVNTKSFNIYGSTTNISGIKHFKKYVKNKKKQKKNCSKHLHTSLPRSHSNNVFRTFRLKGLKGPLRIAMHFNRGSVNSWVITLFVNRIFVIPYRSF